MTKRVEKYIKIEAITKSRQNNVYMVYIRTQSIGQRYGEAENHICKKKRRTQNKNLVMC